MFLVSGPLNKHQKGTLVQKLEVKKLKKDGEVICKKTNNQSEYVKLICAMILCLSASSHSFRFE